MKKLISFLLFLACSPLLFAQSDHEKALKALKTLMQTYTKSQGLSFELQFTYAPESRPWQHLDSLRGSVKIDGNRSWYLIDSTESVNTGNFLVTIFRDDKLLYLAKPASASLPAGTGLSGFNEAWLQNLDSLSKTNEIIIGWKENKEEQELSMQFNGNKQYRSMTYLIDRKTGFLKSSMTIVRADQLMDPETRKEANITDDYAIISTSFLNYTKGRLPDSLFDTGKYFIKKGNEYIGVNEFKDYSVFLGTPGM